MKAIECNCKERFEGLPQEIINSIAKGQYLIHGRDKHGRDD